MPQLDGFAVCEQLKAAAQTRDIPVIFISALDEIQDKVKAFAVGGVDYIIKPFQLEEVLARVNTHLSLRKLQRQLQEANTRFKRELALAGKIQLGILPRELPALKGWQLSATLQPARETSGDFYDVRLLSTGQLAIVIADVVDKGAGAALFMALCCTLLRTYAAEFPEQPELVMHSVNRRLSTDVESNEFVTVFYGVLDPATGTFTYCNAGHNPPYFIKPHAEIILQKLPRTGMPLGIVENAAWTRAAVQFNPGDRLVLYTDGVIDAENVRGEFFGVDRFVKAMRANANRSAEEMIQSISAEAQAFVGQAKRFDDIALVVVGRGEI
jgi:sigma-B regulation protein RsbU (phosphoserine phosphatase)